MCVAGVEDGDGAGLTVDRVELGSFDEDAEHVESHGSSGDWSLMAGLGYSRSAAVLRISSKNNWKTAR